MNRLGGMFTHPNGFQSSASAQYEPMISGLTGRWFSNWANSPVKTFAGGERVQYLVHARKPWNSSLLFFLLLKWQYSFLLRDMWVLIKLTNNCELQFHFSTSFWKITTKVIWHEKGWSILIPTDKWTSFVAEAFQSWAYLYSSSLSWHLMVLSSTILA